jgi:hypothetical protein
MSSPIWEMRRCLGRAGLSAAKYRWRFTISMAHKARRQNVKCHTRINTQTPLPLGAGPYRVS